MTYSGKKLYFLHIPKTGGTSIIHSLRELSSVNKLLFAGPYLIDDLQKNSEEIFSSSNILAGHLGLWPITKGFQFFTVVREPISFLYSLYSHIKRDKNHYFHNLVVEEKMNFKQYLVNDLTYSLNANLQTKYLSVQYVPKFEKEPMSRTYYQEVLEKSDPSAANLDVAIAHINQAEYVGLQNNMFSTQNFLFQRFNCATFEIPTLNINPNKDEAEENVSLEIKMIIKSLSPLDFLLYEYVKENLRYI